MASSTVPRAKGINLHSSERRVILQHSNVSYAMPLVVRNQSQPCDGLSVCFCCFKPEHFARDCHAANLQNGAGAVVQCTGNYQKTNQ